MSANLLNRGVYEFGLQSCMKLEISNLLVPQFKIMLIVVLICISLIMSDVEHRHKKKVTKLIINHDNGTLNIVWYYCVILQVEF